MPMNPIETVTTNYRCFYPVLSKFLRFGKSRVSQTGTLELGSNYLTE